MTPRTTAQTARASSIGRDHTSSRMGWSRQRRRAESRRRDQLELAGGARLGENRIAHARELVHAPFEQAVICFAIATDQRRIVMSGMTRQLHDIPGGML